LVVAVLVVAAAIGNVYVAEGVLRVLEVATEGGRGASDEAVVGVEPGWGKGV